MKDYHIALIGIGATVWGLTLWLDPPAPTEHQGACCSATQQQQRLRPELMLERRFDIRAGGRLMMDVPDGDITVETGGSGALVRVFVGARDLDWGREVFERMQFEVRSEGNNVVVRAEDPQIENWEWRRHRSVNVEVRVTIPQRFDAELITNDGDVRLGDVEGDVQILSADGDLDVGAIKGPRIKLQTQDGDVFAEALEAGQITLYTQDGDMSARRVAGELKATSGDGDITVRLTQPAEANIRTRDGDILIYTAEGMGVELDLRGEDVLLGTGIRLDGQRGRNWIRGALFGGGPRVTATTSDGMIRVRLGH